MAGQAGWRPLAAASDEQLARAVKQILWRRTSMNGVRRDQYLLAVVRRQLPAALDRFGKTAILAAARRPEHPACSWCALRILAAASLEEPPTPTPGLEALLGRQCGRCRHAYTSREVAERERRDGARLTAAGLRRPQRGQPTPTGVIWSADQPQPETVTAALRAAGQRRTTTARDADVCPCEQCGRKRRG
jgi:hypothetical protein